MTMTNTDISEEYYNWMLGLINIGDEYSLLMRKLHMTPFRYILPMDGNRYEDGINLRYQFAYENDIPQSVAATLNDHDPCSVLEMMVALAARCEVHIMHDDDEGDRTGYWFRVMLSNLRLLYMTNENYNDALVTDILNRFLDRRYAKNGDGGLFVLKDFSGDMRKVEIWYQLMWYLSELQEEK